MSNGQFSKKSISLTYTIEKIVQKNHLSAPNWLFRELGQLGKVFLGKIKLVHERRNAVCQIYQRPVLCESKGRQKVGEEQKQKGHVDGRRNVYRHCGFPVLDASF
jgi:hypothetical protein